MAFQRGDLIYWYPTGDGTAITLSPVPGVVLKSANTRARIRVELKRGGTEDLIVEVSRLERRCELSRKIGDNVDL